MNSDQNSTLRGFIPKGTHGEIQQRENIDGYKVDAAKALGFFVSRKAKRLQTNLANVSDLRSKPRSITVVTTAALPWMTGTAVNPILRAVHFARDGHNVMLVVPWVESKDSQHKIYGGHFFDTKEEQIEFMKEWLQEQGLDEVKIRIIFYDGVYSERYGSVFPLNAITDLFAHIDDFEWDVCVLEEPEHLTWCHPGSPWPEIFKIVVGVIHTNYVEYARNDGILGKQKALLLMLLNIWVARSYCHRIIKLCDTGQYFPHSVTCNVHGVGERYLEIGRRPAQSFDRGIYFMAKTLWTKGYKNLLTLLKSYYQKTNKAAKFRFFGNGPDANAVLEEMRGDPAFANVRFEPRVVDHAGTELQRYKVYVNPSVSDVVCTSTAEALAMGKLVVIIKHVSNEFFESFKNCYVFQNADQFSNIISEIADKDPEPLTEDELYRLSWKAATDRFYDSALVSEGSKHPFHVDQVLASCHSTLSKISPKPGKTFRKQQGEEESDDSLAELFKRKFEPFPYTFSSENYQIFRLPSSCSQCSLD